jgi:copper chaperone CopZ
MKELIFKTNLKCMGCVDNIRSYLDQNLAIESWSVDIESPDKILKVKTSLSEKEIIKILSEAGYEASPLKRKSLFGFIKK